MFDFSAMFSSAPKKENLDWCGTEPTVATLRKMYEAQKDKFEVPPPGFVKPKVVCGGNWSPYTSDPSVPQLQPGCPTGGWKPYHWNVPLRSIPRQWDGGTCDGGGNSGNGFCK